MKTIKRRIVTALLLLLACAMMISCMSGCNKQSKYQETEYFRYQVFTSDGEEMVTIKGLTEKGKQLKNIVIPEEIDGKRVVIYEGYDTLPNVKKIIVSCNMGTINSWGFSSGHIFMTNYPVPLKVLYVNCIYNEATIMEPHFLIASAALENYQKRIKNSTVYSIANMQYLSNYENAPNKGVFFIDDLDVNEELEIIPAEPKREGYTFAGWYAEPECQNKVELDGYVKADEEIVYLYAGWKEIL